MRIETTIIDQLYLELSQVASTKTQREIEWETAWSRLRSDVLTDVHINANARSRVLDVIDRCKPAGAVEQQ